MIQRFLYFLRFGYTWTPKYPFTTTDLGFLTRYLICFCIWLFVLKMSVSMDKKCCVPNCGKNRSDGTILHIFPNYVKEPVRFRTWVYAVGGNLLVLKDKTIFKYRRICHNHFEPKYYTASKRLCANAVPTLKLSGLYVRREPLRQLSNISVEVGNQGPAFPMPELHQNTASSSKSVIPLKIITPAEHKKEGEPLVKVSLKKRCQPSLVKKYSDEMSLLRQKIIKLQKSKDLYAKKLKMALDLEENPKFKKTMGNFNSAARTLLTLQLSQINKGKFGRRYTKEEKILSLAFYKMGPKAYRWFRNILILPAPVTLSRMISNAGLKPGLNESIFTCLKNRVQQISASDKLCVLLFDEMALSPHFDYNKRKDIIRGFVDNGKVAQRKIADHVLVFMIRGINKNYKQPIHYSFCSGSTPKIELKLQIKEVITKLQAAGMVVVCTICDQGASNVSAIKELVNDTKTDILRKGQECRNNIFIINGREIVPLFDPPHLLKGIRNNMINKNVMCTINNKVCIGKWDHIIRLYREDPGYNNLRFLPKLTENHVLPEKIKKMKVKFATQVFSASVGMHMGYLSSHGILPEECQQTADILLFLDLLFDSLNGSYGKYKKNHDKHLLGPVTLKSIHHTEWLKSIQVLKSMKFIDTKKNKAHVIPSINNWIWTLENSKYLCDKLFREYNLKSIWMRYLNQDPLENFFGAIRSHGIRNTNPTCAGFEIAFASVLVNNICNHSRGSNCEEDTAQNLLIKSLKKIFFQRQEPFKHINEIDFDDMSENIVVGLNNKIGNVNIVSLIEYVSGYVIRKAKHKIFKNCNVCKFDLLNNEHNKSEYIKLKESSKSKISLTYPSTKATEMFSDMQDIISHILKRKSDIYNIKKYIKTIINVQCHFNFISCNIHKEELLKYLEEICCNFLIFNWCKNTNKILAGIRNDVDVDDDVQVSCVEYANKRKK